MAVRLLGPVRLGAGRAEATLSPKVRQVLAVLALRPGTVVTHDTLIAELWAEDPPRSATTTMQTYIYQLRQAIDGLDGRESGGRVLRTESPGYSLCEDIVAIDLARFRALAAKALAVIAAMHGLPFKSVTNRMRVPEIKDLLLLLGAQIEELPGQTE
ncbi:AfsR/SARP family transcriptional regulator, partial [Nocardia otitidiscaviarum]|uniref:AfsR/SARP family transcriptional regulator n=1 Tax=Nocardia otitidiscaviarum TaxID=1823 RepID=UPI002453B516